MRFDDGGGGCRDLFVIETPDGGGHGALVR
jgi:hypothetical protein